MSDKEPDKTIKEPKVNKDKPPPYGIVTYDLECNICEDFIGLHSMKDLKKTVDNIIPSLMWGEVLFIVDIKAVIIPPAEEEEDDEEFTIMEKAILEEGQCPECQDDLMWDEAEEMWLCPTCTLYYDAKDVGLEPPKQLNNEIETS